EEPLEAEFARFMEEAIQQHRYIGDEDEATLPEIRGTITLREWRPGQYCLRFETVRDGGGLVRALAYKVYRHLGGNIFALTAHAARQRAYVSLYHSLPPDLSLDEARARAKAFGPPA